MTRPITFSHQIRGIIFGCVTCVWTVITSSLFIIPDLFWCKIFKRNSIAVYTYSHGLRCLLKLICGIDIRIIGVENISPGSLILSQHQSVWETVVPLTIFHFKYVFKQELLFVPFFGIFLYLDNMIPVNRKAGISSLKTMLGKLENHLKKKNIAIIFPQGTRTVATDTQETHPYKFGITKLYGKYPFVPAILNSGYYFGKTMFSPKISGTITYRFFPSIPNGLTNEELREQIINTLEEKI
jgi:1-acyl-sn-glycerol-3-phosphate acyltransferase